MTTTHAIYELFEPLLRGVPTLILGDHESRDLPGFWATINAWSATRLLVVPSALQVSLDFPGFAVPTMKVVVLMGEYVHQKLAGHALEAFPEQTSIYSIYGSTEASSSLVCDLRESYRPNHELPLGRPISSDVQAYVLGSDLAPVAPGTTGLLHFGGTALFSEYFKDPKLTDSVFVRSPVASDRLYDTHDQVRLTADGNLEYVGRTDHTVKVRGFRVDIQEVERTLLLHPSISHAAVVLNKSDSGDNALIGFYSPATVTRASVHGFMQEHLPPYMIPSVLVALDQLPRTASGKTDRRRLLDDYLARSAAPTAARALSVTETRVCEIWQDVLRHGDLQADSSFFEVGGTSLTSFAVMHRLRGAFALGHDRFPDILIYQYPTVRGLAAHVEHVLSGAADQQPVASGILVTLSRGSDASLPPIFLIASAGGTLGAYEKLARALKSGRDVIGVRDPYIWGERDATRGFRHWIDRYIDAIRQRQPLGPYHLVAYSSAGAFGYEIARRLRAEGQEVGLLAIIDPFGLDRPTPDSFGYRVMQARFKKPHARLAVRLLGWWRSKFMRLRQDAADDAMPVDIPASAEQFSRRVQESMRNATDVAGFSSLLALNTGVAFAISRAELAKVDPERYFPTFLERVRQVAPEFDLATMTRIFEQYFGLQVPAQQGYPLRRYDGGMLLVEVDDASQGLVTAQFQPHVSQLRVRRLKVSASTSKLEEAALQGLSASLRNHFRCMRDDQFVTALAAELEASLP